MGTVAPACKICGGQTHLKFSLPKSKKTGHPIPELPDDCPYFECNRCNFCFSTHLDGADHTEVYDETYWDGQDPDWHGRVSESMRLVMMAAQFVRKPPTDLEILDFGCGMGAFVETCRSKLQMHAWGTDIIPPKFGRDYFLPVVNRKFDIIVSCEVIEHLPDPVGTFKQMRSWLRPGGVIAFQTAEYNPNGEGREWWYVGPDNGHISLYSRQAFDHLYRTLGGRERFLWRNYAGLQAWRFQ